MSVTTKDLYSRLGETFGAGTIQEPWELYARYRRENPVTDRDIFVELGLPSLAGARGERPSYSVFRYTDVSAALRDHETFANYLKYAVGHPNVLVVTYEEMIADYPAWLDKIIKHAGFYQPVKQFAATWCPCRLQAALHRDLMSLARTWKRLHVHLGTAGFIRCISDPTAVRRKVWKRFVGSRSQERLWSAISIRQRQCPDVV